MAIEQNASVVTVTQPGVRSRELRVRRYLAYERPWPEKTSPCGSASLDGPGQGAAAVPTTGALSWMLTNEPKKRASPKLSTPPSEVTSQ
jgi:hypothetical protein